LDRFALLAIGFTSRAGVGSGVFAENKDFFGHLQLLSIEFFEIGQAKR